MNDDQQRDIGIAVEKLHRQPIDAMMQEIKRLGIDPLTPLTKDDQESILFWSGPSSRIVGHIEPKIKEGISLRHFVLGLMRAMRKMSDEVLRKQILDMVSGATVVSFKANDGRRMVVHKATRTDATSEWQLSSIGYDGIPSGHENPPSFEEACFRALGISNDTYWNWHGFNYEWSNLEKEPAPC